CHDARTAPSLSWRSRSAARRFAVVAGERNRGGPRQQSRAAAPVHRPASFRAGGHGRTSCRVCEPRRCFPVTLWSTNCRRSPTSSNLQGLGLNDQQVDDLTDFLENGLYDPAFVRFDPHSPTQMFELSPPDFLYSVYRPDLAAM